MAINTYKEFEDAYNEIMDAPWNSPKITIWRDNARHFLIEVINRTDSDMSGYCCEKFDEIDKDGSNLKECIEWILEYFKEKGKL